MKENFYKAYLFFQGEFGEYELIPSIKVWWKRFWGMLACSLILWGLVQFLVWWSDIVKFINHVIWG